MRQYVISWGIEPLNHQLFKLWNDNENRKVQRYKRFDEGQRKFLQFEIESVQSIIFSIVILWKSKQL